MKNWTLLALTALAAGAMTLGNAACSSDVKDDAGSGGTSGGNGPSHGSTSDSASEAKAEDQHVASGVSSRGTSVESSGEDLACDDTSAGLGFCADENNLHYCTGGKWYLLDCRTVNATAFCGEDEDTVDCYNDVVTAGAGGSGGSSGQGAGGTGGSGSVTEPGVLGYWETTDSCHVCAASKCSTEAVACDGATVGDNANCKDSGDCIADDQTGANKDKSLDCSVEACQGEITVEPKANDFVVCLAEKCGAECNATAGFMNTAECAK